MSCPPRHICWQQCDLQRAACVRELAAGSTPGRDSRRQRNRSRSRSGSRACLSSPTRTASGSPHQLCELKPLLRHRYTQTQLTAPAPLNPLQNTQSWMNLKSCC